MNAAMEIRGVYYVYDFCCDGCEVQAELKVPIDQHDQVMCPEGCGAIYVQWFNDGKARLTCIVCPISEDAEHDRVT